MGSNLVLDLQRRHAEVFRIRLGSRNARGYPEKLTDAIRVTSRGENIVEAFTRVYGGEVRPWDNQGDPQFEAFLPTTALHVMILPGQSIFQRWEKYARSVCERRCDGRVEEIEGRPCVCPPDVDDRLADPKACNIMTRVNVICPDVEVLGAGSLVSHGRIAAETLPSAISVVEAALSQGVMVPGVLRVVEHKGKNHYVVPQLQVVGVSYDQMTGGELGSGSGVGGRPVQVGGGSGRALPAAAPTDAVGGGRPPLPHELEPPAEIVGDPDGVGSGGGEVPPGVGPTEVPPAAGSTDRAGSTDLEDLMALIKSTKGLGVGTALRKAREIAEGMGLDLPAALDDLEPGPLLDAVYRALDPDDPGPGGPGTPVPVPDAETSGGGGVADPQPAHTAPSGAPEGEGDQDHEGTLPLSASDPKQYRSLNRWAQALATQAAEAQGIPDRDVLRATCAWNESKGRTTSWKELREAELRAVGRWLEAMAAGRYRLVETADPEWAGAGGWTFEKVERGEVAA